MTLTRQSMAASRLALDSEGPSVDPFRESVAWRPLLRKILFGAVFVAGAIVLAVSVRSVLAHPEYLLLVWIAASFAFGVLRLEGDGHWVSLSLIPVIIASYLAGPAGGVLSALAASLGSDCRSRRPMYKSCFNAGVFMLAGLAAAVAAAPLARHTGAQPVLLFSYGLVAAAALHATNVAPMCLVMSLQERINPLKVWAERFRWAAPQTLFLGPVAAGVAVAYRDIGPYELAVMALPVIAMQLSWRQYVTHAKRSVEDLRAKNADLTGLTDRLQLANKAVGAAYQGTLEALVCALDARDNEVQGHSLRVSAYSQAIAQELGILAGSPEWEAITRGALLHDVGKIGVADAVLRKPGALDEVEWSEMRRHCEIGFGILRDVEFLRPAAALVRAHHERFDGNGYPNRLKGEAIPLGARIFAVADAFDAITSDRPYRPAAPPEAALAEVLRCSGTQFDPAVVSVFERIWSRLWEQRERTGQLVGQCVPGRRAAAERRN